MRIYIRPFLIALSLFILFNVGLNLLVQNNAHISAALDIVVANKFPFKLVDISKTADKTGINTIAIGSSITDDGFVPYEFEKFSGNNLNSYNMGLPASRYDVLKYYLSYHLDHFVAPKVIYIEVTDYMLNKPDFYFYMPTQYHQTLMTYWKTYHPATNDDLSIKDKIEILLSRYSTLYRYRGVFSPTTLYVKLSKNIRDRVFNNQSDRQKMLKHVEEFPFPLKGWHPRPVESYMTTDAGIRRNALNLKQVYMDSITNIDSTRLEDLIKLCQKHNIQVILVQWPNHPEYYRIFKQSNLYTSYKTVIQKVINKYHVNMVDLNSMMPEKTSGLFADSRHLSSEGALFFTRKLAEKTKKLIMES